jgi:hypothetical protein
MANRGSGAGADGSSPAPDGGRAPPATSYDAGGCDLVVVSTEPDQANVLIVLDRSGSMRGEGYNRWGPAKRAVREVTAALEDRLRFGLTVFPALGSRSICGEGAACPAGEVRVHPALGTSAAIDADLEGMGVAGATPTARTLRRSHRYLAELEGRSYVLLITDGAPNCNYPESGCGECTARPGDVPCSECPLQCLDDAGAVEAVRNLAADGIKTWVFGYELAAQFGAVMNRLAAVGDTGLSEYIPVSDDATLRAALSAVAGSVIPCEYELDHPIGDVSFVRVTIDDETVPHESAASDDNAWRVEGDSTVALLGGACATLRDGEPHEVRVQVECEPVLY